MMLGASNTLDSLIGRRVGSFVVDELLGEGGMGRVYRAVHPSIGSQVAIKVLRSRAWQDASAVDRFFAEAQAVNTIRHENIVNILDIGFLDEGQPYIVMECLDGAPLGRLMKQGPLPVGTFTRLMQQVLQALAAAHERGIIHRDLKPENIFVTPGGRPVVLDFGIAKLLDTPSGVQTESGVVLGTPAYMSPEQALQEEVDGRSDQYSLGIVLFEGLTGRRPFAGSQFFQMLRHHVETPPPDPCSLRPEIPATIGKAVLRALGKERHQRFETARDFADALEAGLGELSRQDFCALSMSVVLDGNAMSTAATGTDANATSAERPSSREPRQTAETVTTPFAGFETPAPSAVDDSADAECLDENDILALVDGQLEASRRARVERHMATCDSCRALVALWVRHDGAWDGDSGHAELESICAGGQVGGYQLLELLGAGGMGKVFRARPLAGGAEVALKVICAPGHDTELLRARLRREAQLQARIHSPHVAGLQEVGVEGELLYLVMELIVGCDLSDWMATEARTTSDILSAFLGAARGLWAAHRAGVLHRDVKPRNLLMGADGRVRVVDFGLARPLQELSNVDGQLTATGVIVGTPAYMAPEQLAGDDVDARADQYSLCVILYEAVYGRRPFRARRIGDLLAEIRSGDVALPEAPTSTPGLRAIMRRGLQQAPERRFADLAKLIAALEVEHKRISAPARAASPKRTSWKWLAAAATGLVAAGTAVALSMAPEAEELDTRELAQRDRAVAWPQVESGGDRAPDLVGITRDAAPFAATSPDGSAAKIERPNGEIEQPRPSEREGSHDESLKQPALERSPDASLGGGNPAVASNPARTLEQPAPRDGESFDPLAYYPTAQEVAQRVFRDAVLSSMELGPVDAAGLMNLKNGASALYHFTSPDHWHRDDCEVRVIVRASGVTAAPRACRSRDEISDIPTCFPDRQAIEARLGAPLESNTVDFVYKRSLWQVTVKTPSGSRTAKGLAACTAD